MCPPPPHPKMTCGFLIQLVFCKKKTMWFIGVEVEQETSAPSPKKNPGSAHETLITPTKTTRANKLPLSYKTYQTPLLFPLEASHSQYQYSAVFPFLLQAWELVSFPIFKKSIVSASKQHFTVTTIDYTNRFWTFKVK